MSQQSPGGPRRYEQPAAYQDPYRQPSGPQYPGYAQVPGYPQGPGYQQPPRKPKKSVWKRWWMICLYVLVGLIVIGSIGSAGSASKTDDAGHGSNAPSAHSSAGAQASGQSSAAKFGQAYAYEDGLSVTVSAPKPYQPSETAAGTEEYKNFVKFDVRIVNKTGKTWDPSLFTASVQSSNKEGAEVFDSEAGLDGSPTTKLLDGRESEFTVAYGVADPKDIVMEVNPDMLEHEAVMFQS